MATPKIEVIRGDDGVLSYKFTHGTTVINGTGYWDDATPWATGTYSGSFWLFNRFDEAFRFGTPSNTNPISGRENIVIHLGQSSGDTEGCLVDGSGFIDDVYNYLRGQDLAPEHITMLANRGLKDFYNSSWDAIQIEVKDAPNTNHDFDIKMSIDGGSTSYVEGDKVIRSRRQ